MAIPSVARIQGRGDTFLWTLRGELALDMKSWSVWCFPDSLVWQCQTELQGGESNELLVYVEEVRLNDAAVFEGCFPVTGWERSNILIRLELTVAFRNPWLYIYKTNWSSLFCSPSIKKNKQTDKQEHLQKGFRIQEKQNVNFLL